MATHQDSRWPALCPLHTISRPIQRSKDTPGKRAPTPSVQRVQLARWQKKGTKKTSVQGHIRLSSSEKKNKDNMIWKFGNKKKIYIPLAEKNGRKRNFGLRGKGSQTVPLFKIKHRNWKITTQKNSKTIQIAKLSKLKTPKTATNERACVAPHIHPPPPRRKPRNFCRHPHNFDVHLLFSLVQNAMDFCERKANLIKYRPDLSESQT